MVSASDHRETEDLTGRGNRVLEEILDDRSNVPELDMILFKE